MECFSHLGDSWALLEYVLCVSQREREQRAALMGAQRHAVSFTRPGENKIKSKGLLSVSMSPSLPCLTHQQWQTYFMSHGWKQAAGPLYSDPLTSRYIQYQQLGLSGKLSFLICYDPLPLSIFFKFPLTLPASYLSLSLFLFLLIPPLLYCGCLGGCFSSVSRSWRAALSSLLSARVW